jgi:hypothetical protein
MIIYQKNNNVRIAQQPEYTKMHVTLGKSQLFIARSVFFFWINYDYFLFQFY